MTAALTHSNYINTFQFSAGWRTDECQCCHFYFCELQSVIATYRIAHQSSQSVNDTRWCWAGIHWEIIAHWAACL